MKSIIILITFQVQLLFGQTNLILNGGFEDGPTYYPATFAQFTGINSNIGPYNWISQNYVENAGTLNETNSHSPDWYGMGFQNYDAVSSGAHGGSYYMGMANYELIQQPISLEKGKLYCVSLYIQLSNHLGNSYVTNTNSDPLNIYVSDSRIEYSGDDYDDHCDNSWAEFDGSVEQVGTFDLNTNLYPVGTGWYKLTRLIRPRNYKNWIAFQIGGPTNNPCNHQTIVIIDDIKILSICDLPCIPPEAFQPIQYTKDKSDWSNNNFPNAGLTGPNNLIIQLPNGLTEVRTPWHVYIKNALGVEFTVMDRWGTQIDLLITT